MEGTSGTLGAFQGPAEGQKMGSVAVWHTGQICYNLQVTTSYKTRDRSVTKGCLSLMILRSLVKRCDLFY